MDVQVAQLDEEAQGLADSTKDEFWVMTPADAAEVLGWNNYNRNPKRFKVRQYAEDMKNGRWIYNGVPIIIATINDRPDTSILMDGQNRLMAVIEANVTLTFRVNFIECSMDEAMEMMATYDQGAIRSLADIITIARKSGRGLTGYADQNLTACATALSIADVLIPRGEATWRKMSRPAMESYAMSHEDDLRWGAEIKAFFEKRFRGRLNLPVGVLAAAIVIQRQTRSQIMATQFIEQLATGDGLRTGNPIKVLREEMLLGQKSHFIFGVKGTREHIRRYNATIMTWNSWVRGQRRVMLRVRDEVIDPIPYSAWDITPDWAS